MWQYGDPAILNKAIPMLKQAATVAGAALIFSPLGIPLASCGLPGVLVAGAGLFVADAFMKEMKLAAEIAERQKEEAGTRDKEQP